MKKFIVERNLPGAENLSSDELRNLAQTFCDCAEPLDRTYIWIQSFVTEDKIFCLVLADSKDTIRHHAGLGRLPINSIWEVKAMIDAITPTLIDSSTI
jgi:hypothetical protein